MKIVSVMLALRKARKRDEAECDDRIAQQLKARKRKEAKRDFEDDMLRRVAVHRLENTT